MPFEDPILLNAFDGDNRDYGINYPYYFGTCWGKKIKNYYPLKAKSYTVFSSANCICVNVSQD